MNQDSKNQKQWYAKATIRSVILYVVLMVFTEVSIWAVINYDILSEQSKASLASSQPWAVIVISVLFLWFYSQALIKQYRKPNELLSEYLKDSSTIHFELRKHDGNFRAHWVSQNAERILGYSVDEIKQANWWYNNLHPSDRSSVVKRALRGLEETEFVYEYRFRHANGHYIWVRDELHRTDSSGKQIKGSWVDISHDIGNSDYSALRSNTEHSIKIGIAEINADNQLTRVDAAFANILGLSPQAATGIGLEDILTPIAEQNVRGRFPQNQAIEVIGRRPNHERFKAQLLIRHCLRGEHLIACLTDTTLVEQQQQALHKAAYFDDLTGLPNLRCLHTDFKSLIDGLPDDRLAALLTININKFHHINHRYGSLAGDKALQRVAKRLKEKLPFGNKLYAIGGDEFVVLITNVTEYIDVQLISENILSVFDDKFIIDNTAQFHLTCSSGTSIYPMDGYDSEQLLTQARSTMIQSRESNLPADQQTVQPPSHFYLQLSEDVKSADFDQQFKVYYQPIFDPAKKVVGAEALLRWQHPEFGLLTPNQFLDHAEESDQLNNLGLWVLDSVVTQLKTWLTDNSPIRYISMNLSSPQLTPAWLQRLAEHCEQEPKLSEHLGIELSESVLNEADTNVQTAVQVLSSLGIDIIIDDFGTGFSSVSYLADFPIKKVKIDRSLITSIASSDRARHIVSAMINFAQTIGVDVFAEGVEDEQQLELILSMGCVKWQGHLIHPAKPVDELNALD